jgi:hypothetical protein
MRAVPPCPPKHTRRLLANLYNGNVYLWNYNDSVREGRKQVAPSSSTARLQQWSLSVPDADASGVLPPCLLCPCAVLLTHICRRWSSHLRSQTCRVRTRAALRHVTQTRVHVGATSLEEQFRSVSRSSRS